MKRTKLLGIEAIKRFVLVTLPSLLLCISPGYAQRAVAISGSVTDSNGEAIAGATIEVKGTQTGTITEANGSFEIKTAPTSTLIFSYMGYLSQEIAVNNKTKINVVLKEDAQSIDDVVVVGYGSVRRSDLTGSVASVTPEALTTSSKSNVLNAMQGQIAGVNISRSNNRPGEGFSITIRGNSSISGTNAPLVVIDGVPGADLESVNPEDIEKLDILKDASATAIYGSRGANGVIIVTTKRGEKGRNNIRYSGYFGLKTASNIPEFTEGQDYVDIAMEYHRTLNGGEYKDLSEVFTDPSELKAAQDGNFYNWFDALSKNGFIQSHTVSATGGNDKTQYTFGAGYYDETGMMDPERYTRYTVRASVDVQPNNYIKFGGSAYLTYDDKEAGNADLWQDIFRARPTQHPYDLITGEQTFKFTSNGIFNPMVTQDNIKENTIGMSILANAYVDITPVKGLSIKSIFSPYLTSGRWGLFRGTMTKALQGTQQPIAVARENLNMNYVWDNIINYNVDFGKHALELTGVFSASRNQGEEYYQNVKELPFDSLWYGVGTAGAINILRSSYRQYQMLSYLARANYSYDDRFLLTVSGRYDGSSKLAEGSKWGFFPSAAAAWRISEEDFLDSAEWLSNLKLRLSYGIIGNDSVSPYQTAGTLSATKYVFGDSSATGFVPGSFATTGLTWEKTREYNVGFDFGFLDNRINASIDYYDRLTYDLIMSRSMSSHTGFSSVKDNVGSVKNSGIEFALNTVNIKTDDFRWSTNLTLAYNKNQVWDLDYKEDLSVYSDQLAGMEGDYKNKWFIGQPININWVYICDGVWQLDEAEEAAKYGQKPGQWKVKDQNNDGKIIAGEDSDIYGKRTPDFTGGMTNTFNYKNFDLSVHMYFSTGMTARSQLFVGYIGENNQALFKGLKHDFWTPENPTNSYAQPGNQGKYRNGASQIYLKPDYLKIGHINLGYTFNKELVQRAKMSNARIYTTIQNPFVFSNYPALDPEDPFETGLGDESFMFTTYMLGLDITF